MSRWRTADGRTYIHKAAAALARRGMGEQVEKHTGEPRANRLGSIQVEPERTCQLCITSHRVLCGSIS
jgi:hypothetical protein